LKSQSERLEKHRDEVTIKGGKGAWHLPNHYTLKGGMFYTVQGLYRYRGSEREMREVYYLAGLVDCMINRVSPLLRTDLLRDIYRRVVEMKSALKMNWYGQMDQVLFPLDDHLYSMDDYQRSLAGAGSMKTLYRFIGDGTNEMFDILSLEYAFYTPGRSAG
jgi:hypothetical protein